MPPKKVPGKPILARRSTKGPLDEDDDPLATSLASSQLSPPSSTTSALEQSVELASTDDDPESTTVLRANASKSPDKDLSFLLESGIYHPLGQLDVPTPFRKPFPPPPSPDTTLQAQYANIDDLLAQCHLLGAAHLAALVLTSGIVTSTDSEAIFRLLAIRYSSLELSGNTLLAAQEAKALEDLSSAFYYYEDASTEANGNLPSENRRLPRHIMPFDLRLQAVRLQSIGFSDARRGVSALYDLGMECREHLASASTEAEDIPLWQERLEEVAFRVVNALIETGDLDCAQRTLDSMKPQDQVKSKLLIARKILLALKMGNIRHAQDLVHDDSTAEPEKSILLSLLDVAAGRYIEARDRLLSISNKHHESELYAIAQQNLAVAHLYTGTLLACRSLLENLVDTNNSFQTLITNLATVYELSSDRARDLKLGLIDRVASKPEHIQHKAYINADFRL